jgi:hypothetical protein
MPLPARLLRVLPNPWKGIDHLGRPAAALPFDAFEHSPSPGFVGAAMLEKEIAPAQRFKVGTQSFATSPAQVERRLVYDIDPKNPVVIPNTAYYRQHIASGDLIPADAATAALAGITKFDGAEKMLARARAEAIERFNAETGPDAWKEFGSNEPTKRGESERVTASETTPAATPARKEKGDS